jgi:ribosomal protein S21
MKDNKNKVAKVTGNEVNVNIRDGRKHHQEVNDALKELKKRIKKSGLMQELRKREAYDAPSKKRRLKHEESLKQRKRDARKATRQQNDLDF